MTWDEIQQPARPALGFSVRIPSTEVLGPTKPNRRGLFIVVCIFGGLLVLGGVGIVSWLAYGRSAEAFEIEKVLKQDAVCSRETKSIAEIVNRMKAIDTSSCPTDFRAAYLTHLHAWDMMADVEKEAIELKNDSESATAVVESLIRGFLGDPFGKAIEVIDAQDQLQREYKEASEKI